MQLTNEIAYCIGIKFYDNSTWYKILSVVMDQKFFLNKIFPYFMLDFHDIFHTNSKLNIIWFLFLLSMI
jgi:hypothetical protein